MRNRALSMGLWLVLSVFAGCGTRQPAEEAPPPPDPVPVAAEGCPDPALGANVAITAAINEASSPTVAFDGQAFALAWWDMHGQFPAVSTVRVDRAGAKLGDVHSPPHEGASRDQTIATDSREAHLVWMDRGAVKSVRLGEPPGSPVKIANKATAAAAGPRGAVAWIDKGVLYFGVDGMEGPPTVVHSGGIEDPRVAWNGSQFAVVWSSSAPGGRQIMLQRLSNRGARLGGAMVVSGTSGVSRNPEIAAARDGFAVVWTNAAPEGENPRDRYRIFFAAVGPRGDRPVLTRQLGFNGSADHVAIAGAGSEFGVVWVGSVDGGGSAVFFARLDGQGRTLGRTLRVSDDNPFACGRPSLAFAGDGFGVSWQDDRDESGSSIIFTFLGCEPAAPPADAGVFEVADAGPAPEAAPAPPPAPATDQKKPDEPKLKKVFR